MGLRNKCRTFYLYCLIWDRCFSAWIRRLGFYFDFCHWVAIWPCTCCFTSLGISFHIYKVKQSNYILSSDPVPQIRDVLGTMGFSGRWLEGKYIRCWLIMGDQPLKFAHVTTLLQVFLSTPWMVEEDISSQGHWSMLFHFSLWQTEDCSLIRIPS